MPDLGADRTHAGSNKRSHRPHTHVIMSCIAAIAAGPRAGGHGRTATASAGPCTRGGAPGVRSTATIYVGGPAGPAQVKIGGVTDRLSCGITAGDNPATR